MDDLLAALESLALGLALVLALLAFLAAGRYSDRRFAFVGAGLGSLGVVSLLGLIALFTNGDLGDTSLGYPSVIFLLLAEAFLYLSLVTRRPQAQRAKDG